MIEVKNKPLFKVGDSVKVSLKGKAEDGMYGTVGKVLPYDGPKCQTIGCINRLMVGKDFLVVWRIYPKDGW